MNLILSNHDILVLVLVGIGVLIAIIVFIVYIRKNRRRIKESQELWQETIRDTPTKSSGLDIDKDITYPPERASVHFVDGGFNDERKELLSKTHVEVKPGIWVDKEHASVKPIVYGEMTPLIAEVIKTHKEKTEGIGNLVNGILEHKQKEEETSQAMKFFIGEEGTRNEFIVNEDKNTFVAPKEEMIEEFKEDIDKSSLKEGEEDILDLMLKFLKEK